LHDIGRELKGLEEEEPMAKTSAPRKEKGLRKPRNEKGSRNPQKRQVKDIPEEKKKERFR
jgi:hypothetical protein